MEKKEASKLAKEQRAFEKAEREKKYRRAKGWQMALYPLSGVAHNSFMFLMTLVSYYAAGIVGLGTVIASLIVTGSRVFDGITDPIIALVFDKTKGKFGKVRPFMVIAYVTMSLSTLLIYFTTHLVPEGGMRLIYFILLYAIFIIGYTFSGITGPAGNSVITNDPQQRPVFGGITMIYTMAFYAIATVYLTFYLTKKYGGFTDAGLFQEFTFTTIIVAGITFGLAILGIWSSDRAENYSSGKLTEKIKFKDLWPILKGNRPLQMFIVSATTDKLGMQIHGNAVVSVMLFGIIIGNYELLGTVQGISMIPNILLLIFGIRYASKFGTKKGYVLATWACIITHGLLFLLLWLGDPTQIGMDNMGFTTIAFLLLYLISGGVRYIGTGLTTPMIPDIVDYEAYRSGRFVPGIIGAIYSFIDKAVSSFAQTVVGLMLAFIGFKSAFPDINTPYSESIFWVTMLLAFGGMMLAWFASLIAMKFYDLDKDCMIEIQAELDARRKDIKNSDPNAAIS